jgi:hypothetical protein
MEYGANSVQGDAYARSRAFCNFGVKVTQQRLNVGPPNIRLHWVSEEVGERLVVLAAHAINDTTE